MATTTTTTFRRRRKAFLELDPLSNRNVERKYARPAWTLATHVLNCNAKFPQA